MYVYIIVFNFSTTIFIDFHNSRVITLGEDAYSKRSITKFLSLISSYTNPKLLGVNPLLVIIIVLNLT